MSEHKVVAGASERLTSIDALRGLAALGILFHHFGDKLGMGDWRDSLYILVDLFFMLSGYVLCHRYLAAIETRQLSLRSFFLQRLIRLWPVHAVWLSITIAIAFLLLPRYCVFPIVPGLVSDTLLLQATGLLPQSMGAGYNVPAWSISAELWVNLLWFALVAFGVLQTRAAIVLMALLPALMFVVYNDGSLQSIVVRPADNHVMHNEILRCAGINAALLRCCISYFIGVLLYRARHLFLAESAILPRLHAVLAIIAAVYFVMRVSMGGYSPLGVPDDLVLVAIIFPLFLTASLRFARLKHLLAHPVFMHFGLISYALYLAQYPLSMLFLYVGWQLPPWVREGLLWKSGFFLLVWVSAILTQLLIEQPTRRWARKNLRPEIQPRGLKNECGD